MIRPRNGFILFSLGMLLVSFRGAGTGAAGDAGPEKFIIREDFDTMDRWEPVVFPKIRRHTRYTLEKEGRNSVLRADADASASAVVHDKVFSPRDFPKIRWRWKIQGVLAGGNAKAKKGDDYPIRVYVIFAYDPSTASLGERIEYGAAKLFYGRYPPHSSLNYIWANRDHPESHLSSTYTDKSKMFLLQKGDAEAGRWVTETRDIVADYRTVFGEDPPQMASVAVMADTDNTGERVTAWVDDLTVFRPKAHPERLPGIPSNRSGGRR